MPPPRLLFALALGIVLALAGCGWAPLYADRETEPADVELRAIKVDPSPDRIGQRLAWALRESFNPTGVPTPQRYRLSTLLTTARADLGIQSTGLGSRGKFDANAIFTNLSFPRARKRNASEAHRSNTLTRGSLSNRKARS